MMLAFLGEGEVRVWPWWTPLRRVSRTGFGVVGLFGWGALQGWWMYRAERLVAFVFCFALREGSSLFCGCRGFEDDGAIVVASGLLNGKLGSKSFRRGVTLNGRKLYPSGRLTSSIADRRPLRLNARVKPFSEYFVAGTMRDER